MPKIQRKFYRKVQKGVKSFLNEIEIMPQTSNAIVTQTAQAVQTALDSSYSSNNTQAVSDLPFQESDTSNTDNCKNYSDISDTSNSDIYKYDYLLQNEILNIQEHSDDILPLCQFDKSISESLSEWSVKHKITHSALSDLLKTLNPFLNNCLPVDARTLLQTPRTYIIRSVEPGSYFHFGLENCLKNLIIYSDTSELLNLDCLEILINIDGLPLSKSSSSQFYPILCSLVINKSFVDMVGIYHGYEKPLDPNSFLSDFINEAVQLTQNGFTFNKRHFSFKIKGFVCDVPAKSFILQTKGHSGYFSCSKCNIEGKYINGRVCFPEEKFNLRTDSSFRQKLQEDHHIGTSIIEQLPNFNIIKSFVIDPMHLLYLGVVKKLIHLWVNGRPPSKLQYKNIVNISDLLVSLKEQIPCEFNRKSRALGEYKRWKATEFRQFLLYTGPVVLKKVLNNDMYLNFITLHMAVTILSNHHLQSQFIHQSENCFKYFFQTFLILYGKDNASHNVHNVLHLANDARFFGVLDKFSAFHFENYMAIILNMIRKSDKPLEQIIRRKAEINNLLKSSSQIVQNKPKFPQFLQEHFGGATLDIGNCDFQYKKAIFANFTLNVNRPDNCCGLKDGGIVLIQNFVSVCNEHFIVGKKFNKTADFYMQPCQSSDLGIYLLNNKDLGPLQSWNVNDIFFKYVFLHFENETYVALPLVHLAH